MPIFASGTVMTADDEVREAYYAFSDLGCEEQLWDYEGKEVDNFVVEKLLATYGDYFRREPLGARLRLTHACPIRGSSARRRRACLKCCTACRAMRTRRACSTARSVHRSSR